MDAILEHLPLTYSQAPLLFWVLGSALAYALASNALWLVRSSDPGIWEQGRWTVEVGRFLFYLVVPYLALGGWPMPPFQGLLLPEDMGWIGFNPRWPATRWLESVGTGLALGLGLLLILLLAWISANRHSGAFRLRFPPRPWWAVLVDVLYLEVHWAFYRGALAVAFDDMYAGVFLGLGLVYLEWALSPFWRWGWRTRSLAAMRWLRAALALGMALIFLLTRNLWVCVAVHACIEMAFWQLGRRRSRAPAA
jgi:hypothetical protein